MFRSKKLNLKHLRIAIVLPLREYYIIVDNLLVVVKVLNHLARILSNNNDAICTSPSNVSVVIKTSRL